ncbi:hypothetical protein ABPG75_003190 [Micractinium tetrahymenae]
MRLWALLAALCALASAGCAATLLRGRLQAFAVTDLIESEHRRVYTLRTQRGQYVPLVLDAAQQRQLAGLQGAALEVVAGKWLPTRSSSPASRRGKQETEQPQALMGGQRGFRAGSIRVLSAAGTGQPAVQAAAVSASSAAAADQDGATASRASGLALSSNPPLESDMAALFIPIAAVRDGATTASGACPRTALPILTPAQVRRALFNRTGGPATLGSLLSACSHGAVRLEPPTSRVAEITTLPCSGSTYGNAWSFSEDCTAEALNGMADAADAALEAQGLRPSRYRHQVYLLPPSDTCGLVGVAQLGCDAPGTLPCRVWIGGGHWTAPAAVAHELLHNLFVDHAGRAMPDGTANEYGDGTSVMGACCADRCPNTPDAWQLGWILVQQLDLGSLPRGETVLVTLPSQSLSPSGSGLHVLPGWAPSAPPLFVGYRTQHRGDAALDPSLAGKVHVYSSVVRGPRDSQPSSWLAALADEQSYEQPGSGLVVRVKALGPQAASVTVCRRGGMRETAASCANGQDWDCNGLAGPADSACAKLRPLMTTAKP